MASASCLDFAKFSTCYESTASECADGAAADSRLPSDAGAAGDATRTFCDSLDASPTFCDAFDIGTWSPDWDRINPTLATLRVDGAGAFAPPGLLVDVAKVESGPVPVATLSRTFDGNFKQPHLSFAIWPDDVTGRTTAAPSAIISVQRGLERSELQLVLGPSPFIKEMVWDADNLVKDSRDDTPSSPLLPGRWTRVSMDVSIEGTPRGKVRFDDTQVVDVDLVGTWAPGPVLIQLGIVFAEIPTQEFSVRFDDVVVDLH